MAASPVTDRDQRKTEEAKDSLALASFSIVIIAVAFVAIVLYAVSSMNSLQSTPSSSQWTSPPARESIPSSIHPVGTPTPEVGEEPDKRSQAFSGDPTVLEAQRLLKQLGYHPGPADGIMGPKTRSALREFQNDRHWLDETGDLSHQMLLELKKEALLQ